MDLRDIAALKHLVINAQVDSYELIIDDDGAVITMNKGTATNLTFPLNASVAFELGTQILFLNRGAGTMTFVAGGTTLISDGSMLDLATGKSASAILIDTDTWFIMGGLQ